MKLIYRIISRISIGLFILLTAWATIFYYIIIEEINDETDDSLEDYSEYIIMRALAGEKLPEVGNGTNNSYHIREVAAEYADEVSHVQYYDQDVYIHSKKETEPARVLRTIFRDSENRYHELTVLIPTFEKTDLQGTILWWIIFLYIFLLLAIIAVNAWIIYRSFRPLYVLLDWLDKLTLGRDIPPLDNHTTIKEFQRLNDALVRNASRNNEMYEEQRIFIGNASHEMQTPITVCRNRLEILANDPALTEQQLGEVLKTRQTLEQLSRLNRTLLLLTRIENRQFPENTEVDVNQIVDRLVEDYAEIYEGREIDIEIAEEGRFRIFMNESLASTLLGNLIKNAFVHTPQNGSIKITVSENSVSVSNTATNGPLDKQLIFQRFYHGPAKSGSMGLGLSLAESICRLYRLKIEYDYLDGYHRFTITTKK